MISKRSSYSPPFRTFDEARVFARFLGLKNVAGWQDYCKSGELPKDIPSGLNGVYRDQGWAGYGDWLGIGNVANHRKEYRPFEEARDFARSWNLRSTALMVIVGKWEIKKLMKKYFAAGTALPLLTLAFFILIPSTYEVAKYTGSLGMALFLVVGLIGFFVGYWHIVPKFLAVVTERQSIYLAIATIIILAISFTIVYPIVDSGIVGGGSDRDEALDLAAREFLSGRYPYYPLTYLGGLITPLPGAVLLAIPFVLLGTSAYQNLFWLVMFFFITRAYFNDGRVAILLLWITALSPLMLQQLVTGGDLLANGLYVIISLWLITRMVPDENSALWKKLLAAIFFGMALSSRGNYIVLLPLVFSMLVQNTDWRTGILYTAITCSTFCVITLPFYIYDQEGFSPLHVRGFFENFDSIIPQVKVVFPIMMGLTSVILAFQRMDKSQTMLLRNCAIVQGSPIVLAIVLSSVESGELTFGFVAYGASSLFFSAIAMWAILASKHPITLSDQAAGENISLRRV